MDGGGMKWIENKPFMMTKETQKEYEEIALNLEGTKYIFEGLCPRS